MKILLITSVYKNEVVGPARFARLLESSPLIDVHVLTNNVKETKTLKSINIKYPWWQQKLKIYFSISSFSSRVNELKDKYDILLYNSSVLVDYKKIASPYIVMVNDEKLASLNFSFNFDFIRRSIHRKIEKKAVQNAYKVIVNSNYLKDRMADAYSIESNKIHILYKGISLDNKQSVFKDNLPSKKTIDILFVKNDFKIGGLTDLISALGMLNRNTFNLTIIGTNQKINEYLTQHHNVTYFVLGFQSNEEVIKSMYNHDILCIPARFEPLGVAVMEGLAIGIPTVTTGVGGLPEVTENGKHVWQCEPNNPQSIAAQIKACLSNQDMREAKSRSGREYIHSTFNIQQVIKKLEEIILS